MNATSFIIQFDQASKQVTQYTLDNIPLDFSHYFYWIHLDLNHLENSSTLLSSLKLTPDTFKINRKDEFFHFFEEMKDGILLKIKCLTDQAIKLDGMLHDASLYIYMTDHYCLTVSDKQSSAITRLKNELLKTINPITSPMLLLSFLLHYIINDFLDYLLELERLSDQIDLDFRHVSQFTYKKLLTIKRRVIKIKRYTAVISDIVMRLSGKTSGLVTDPVHDALRDLMMHCQMVKTEADVIRDVIKSSLDAINNSLMTRMNETMRVLTVYALLFMPLTVITGIYGMNFQYMPELSWRYGYYVILGLMVLTIAAMFYVFKKRRWL